VEWKDQHHDDGLAYDDGVFPGPGGCYIWDQNYSYGLITKSKECVINVPTTDLTNEVVGIGNCTGDKIDKFKKFGLTPIPATEVGAPLIKECHANFECRLAEGRMISKYGLFIWEVVKAHVASSPKYPQTLHYRGDGVFMISGRSINLSRKFKPQNL
jgi:flavin reductase (DIM6/NTAB) family NADH-FMN oxidoreductase RutF